jgi:prepilin-type N-terminal cleavage/methylation domain-containing protein
MVNEKKSHNLLKREKGFTLIELLLYIAVLSTAITAIFIFFFMMLQARVKNQTISEVEQQGSQLMQLMTQTIRNSNTINSPAVGSPSSTLSLGMDDVSKNPTIFDLSGGVLRIKEGSGAIVSLTNSQVTVTNLQFSNISRTGTQGTVRIEFTITYNNVSGRNEYEYSKTFYNSATLRY